MRGDSRINQGDRSGRILVCVDIVVDDVHRTRTDLRTAALRPSDDNGGVDKCTSSAFPISGGHNNWIFEANPVAPSSMSIKICPTAGLIASLPVISEFYLVGAVR